MDKLAKANQSVEKIFLIIEAMAKNKEPLRLQDIAASVDMPASTTLRMVNTLVKCGYAYQDKVSLKYSLSLKFMHIGSLVSSQLNIRDIVHPYLAELSRCCEESSCLAIEQDMEVVYIDVVDGPDGILKITQRIGKRAPMHSTGVGKLLLLNYLDEEIDRYVEKKELTKLTDKTISTKEELLNELKKVKEQGFAVDDEECEIGVQCFAAPLMDYTGKVIAAISVSGATSHMSKEKVEKIKENIFAASEEISHILAYGKNI